MKKKKFILGIILLLCIILVIALNISTNNLLREAEKGEEVKNVIFKVDKKTDVPMTQEVKEQGDIVLDKNAVLLY
ncbi:MAG: hypothetical protein PHP69_02420 [Candidatus Omnitrophica bacterium]|nr:hypothetical protein [Candidatus Omnitrophota bacterium]MDD5080857.1 hypothetical protein [Candidatus Omnitrophota bacterium]